MPVSPTPDDAYWWEIAQAYQQAELDVLGQIRDRLARGVSLTDQAWATARLAEVQQMRRDATARLGQVNRSMASKINGAFGNAYKDGAVAALKDAAAYLPERPSAVSSDARRRAVGAIAAENTSRLAETMPGILRRAEDDYRSVVSDVVRRTAAGGVDRRTATDRALKAAYGKGLKAGPNGRMNLPDYVTMATRTGVAKAMIEGHLDSLGANGIDLVYISPGPRHCDRCDGWANRPLHRTTGTSGTVETMNVVTGNTNKVKVYGSLDDARAAGWGHPNCRCSVGAYLPGATALPTPRPKWDEQGYAAQQDQRRLERQIRDAKLRAQLSTDPKEKAKAEREVKLGHSAIRAHLEAHPALKRQSKREQLAPQPGTSGPTTPPRTRPTPPRAPVAPRKAAPTPPKPPAPAPKPAPKPLTLAEINRKLKAPGLTTREKMDLGAEKRRIEGAAQAAKLNAARAEKLTSVAGTKFVKKFGPDPGKTVSVSAARRGTNPNGRGFHRKASALAREWEVNCSRVSATFELRSRGYDVTAGPRPASKVDHTRGQIVDNWRTKDGQKRAFTNFHSAKDLEREALKQPEGSRFFVFTAWKGGGGHIFNAVVEKGQLRYVEAQTDNYMNAATDPRALAHVYNNRMDWDGFGGQGVGIMRVDDMVPQDYLVNNDWVRPA